MTISIEVRPEVEEHREWMEKIEEANEMLEAMIRRDRSSTQVNAVWSVGWDDQEQPVLQLQLTDWSGSTEASFPSGKTLNEPTLFRWNVRQAWMDLLSVRSDALWDKMLSESE